MASRHIESTGKYLLTWDCASNMIKVTVRLEWNFEWPRGRGNELACATLRPPEAGSARRGPQWGGSALGHSGKEGTSGSTKPFARCSPGTAHDHFSWTTPSTATKVSRRKCLVHGGHPCEQLPVVLPLPRDGLNDNWRCLSPGEPAGRADGPA
jgi:hypothetical protein